MDLTLDIEEQKLNIRSAVIIVHNNKILTHKDINNEYYCLPGGRVQIGENSEKTAKREIKEELGKEIQITGYVTTIENFFEIDGIKYHEIYFLHKAEFIDEKDQRIENTMHNIEGEDYLQYEWLDLEKIESYKILPKCIKESLEFKKFPIHVINDDLKDNMVP